MAIPNIRTHISLLMRYRSLENEYAKLDLGLLLKPHSMTKIGNISSSMEMRYIVLVVILVYTSVIDSIGKIVLHFTI